MKVKGANGITFNVPSAVATGMIAVGLVVEVASGTPEDSALQIAQLTDEGTADAGDTEAAGESNVTGDTDEGQAPAENPADSEE